MNITKLSNSIANLIHLRFLDLFSTKIKRLPDEVCKLYNLQTLRLLNCQHLAVLPSSIGKLVNLRHLEMSDTKLKEMPRGITNLQNLQTLTTFVVSKQPSGLKLGDLRCFPYLQGKLFILELQNVIDAMDASEANLKSREQIDELTFHWDSTISEGSQIEVEVFDQLQPSFNLRELNINCYGGSRFPKWLGDFSFVKIELLHIVNCDHCISLPPLGQLPSLKELEVQSMKSVKTIGAEFYGSCSSSFQPFPSLMSLQFSNMSEWEEWLPFMGDDIEFPFPCLRNLSLHRCPKLRGYLPKHLPSSLTNVEIVGCNDLEASTVIWITSIEGLRIDDGSPHLLSILENDSQNLLKSLHVKQWDSLTSIPKMVVSSNYICSLYLSDISSLTSFPTKGLPTLQTLYIYHCRNLEFQTEETWYNYKSLQHLRIHDSCDSLTSFPLGCFPALKFLQLRVLPNLKSISILDDVSAQSLSCLKIIYLSQCPNLESFPQGGLHTPNLSHLTISSCEKLASLPEEIGTLTTLQDLHLIHPHSIASCPQGGLPPNLQLLCIRISPLAIGEWGFQLLTCLSRCEIKGDELVNALLKVSLLPTSLVSLTISDLDNLKFLDRRGIQHLSSLEELYVRYCKNLVSLSVDNLPPSLKELHISDCPLLKFFDGRGIQHLSSLEEIAIYRCESLKTLSKDRLPPSLMLLKIRYCPLLEARYKSQSGKHWSKIAHIPVIKIDEKVIIWDV